MIVNLDKNGYVRDFAIIGTVSNGIEVECQDMDTFLQNPCAHYCVENVLYLDESKAVKLNEEWVLTDLRRQREVRCFSVINRGKLWYDKLTEVQLEELDAWYNAWLNVTETLTIPEKPSWIDVV